MHDLFRFPRPLSDKRPRNPNRFYNPVKIKQQTLAGTAWTTAESSRGHTTGVEHIGMWTMKSLSNRSVTVKHNMHARIHEYFVFLVFVFVFLFIGNLQRP